jgi:hypothetical protein
LPAALSTITHARTQPGRKPTQHPANQQGNQQCPALWQAHPSEAKVETDGVSVKGTEHNAGGNKKQKDNQGEYSHRPTLTQKTLAFGIAGVKGSDVAREPGAVALVAPVPPALG